MAGKVTLIRSASGRWYLYVVVGERWSWLFDTDDRARALETYETVKRCTTWTGAHHKITAAVLAA